MKMLFRTPYILLLLVVGCFLIARPEVASAQGIVTGTITGTITDASGAVVPNAPVVATNTATGIKVTGKTGAAGEIALKDVPLGTYTVVVTAPGFCSVDGEQSRGKFRRDLEHRESASCGGQYSGAGRG